MIGVIIIAEGEFDGDVFWHDSQEEADAFCEGVSRGAGLYGCGSCSAYTLADLKWLDPKDDADAINLIKEYLSK